MDHLIVDLDPIVTLHALEDRLALRGADLDQLVPVQRVDPLASDHLVQRLGELLTEKMPGVAEA
jgi:hypothetical protein